MKRTIESITGGTILLECKHTAIELHDSKIGDFIKCQPCNELIMPEGLSAYKKTPTFTQDTIPKGFRRAHSTKKGVWALIIVLSGKVRYVIDYLDDHRIDLDSSTRGIIAPQMEHHLEVLGPVQLYVEFYTTT